MDLLGKLDAGEFVVMLPGSSASAAKIVGQRVRSSISLCPIPMGAQQIRLELDLGVASVQPDDDAAGAIARAKDELEAASPPSSLRPKPKPTPAEAGDKLSPTSPWSRLSATPRLRDRGLQAATASLGCRRASRDATLASVPLALGSARHARPTSLHAPPPPPPRPTRRPRSAFAPIRQSPVATGRCNSACVRC